MAAKRPGSLARDALLSMRPMPMDDSESTASGEDAAGDDEGFAEVADQMFDAQQSGDKEGFKDALRAAIESCMSASPKEDY